MPELPDVEGYRRTAEKASGRRIFAPAGEAEVLMHFGMTGRLDWERRGTDRHVHDRIVFVCRGGELRYRNMRKFGGVWISRAGRERVTGPLGPDATEVDLDRFRELLASRRGGGRG